MEYYFSQILWSGVYFQGRNKPNIPTQVFSFLYFHGVCLVFVVGFFKMFFIQLANMILPDDENFLLLFRRETPLDNSVEFMRVCISTSPPPPCTPPASSTPIPVPSVEHSLGNRWVLWKQNTFRPVQVEKVLHYLRQQNRGVVPRTGPRVPRELVTFHKRSQPPISHATIDKTSPLINSPLQLLSCTTA